MRLFKRQDLSQLTKTNLEVDVEPTDSKVTPLPADATDHESGEDVEVIDSDLEEGDNISECLHDYCF